MQRSYQKTRRELCGKRRAHLLFKRRSVFKTTWQFLKVKNYAEHYEKVIAGMLSQVFDSQLTLMNHKMHYTQSSE